LILLHVVRSAMEHEMYFGNNNEGV
jgi:hypothetical protein